MPEPPPLQGPPDCLYEEGYSLDPASAALYARWEELDSKREASEAGSTLKR